MILTLFIAIVGIHGLIHLMGFAKAFEFAELPQLTRPIPRPWGLLWLLSALLLMSTAAAVLFWPRGWWGLGVLALLASQGAIASSWRDAKFGTIPNLLLLAGVLNAVLQNHWR